MVIADPVEENDVQGFFVKVQNDFFQFDNSVYFNYFKETEIQNIWHFFRMLRSLLSTLAMKIRIQYGKLTCRILSLQRYNLLLIITLRKLKYKIFFTFFRILRSLLSTLAMEMRIQYGKLTCRILSLQSRKLLLNMNLVVLNECLAMQHM